MLLHEKIKLIRTNKNLTQAEFSKILGISQGKVSELEKGINKPSFDTLKSMYDKLSVSIDMLMEDNPKRDIFVSADSNSKKLTDYEINILTLLSQLPDREKYKLEGMLEYKVSELTESKAKKEQKVYSSYTV
ncbi:MAG: helix-turn-helix transcriptional regulator [Eubacteriales bacterium]|nr:helix-turn-helix transcriptional regulator [Eubacteriales bacterium]